MARVSSDSARNIFPTMTTPPGAASQQDRRGGHLVARRALRDGVYDAILELLLDGSVAPGASIGIDALARQLGVSPTPVREAMVQLEHTGLVTRAALKGYRAAPPLSAGAMSELVDIPGYSGVRSASADADSIVSPGARRAMTPTLGRSVFLLAGSS